MFRVLTVFGLLLGALASEPVVSGGEDEVPVASGGEGASTTKETYVKQVTEEDFQDFVTQPVVKIMYFYKKDVPRMRKFKREFEKSATYLSIYNVEFGWVDCTQYDIKEYCDRHNVEQEILAFKDGEVLLDLTLETMFDVNSMVSNVLQIVLLREVPILQTRTEFLEFLNEEKGAHDVVFGFFPAIGTYDHRVFMEVAFSHQDNYKFALTTEKESLGDMKFSTKRSAVWAFRCKQMVKTEGGICPEQPLRGKLDLVSLAKFVRALGVPAFYEVRKPEDLDHNPYFDVDIHLAIIFHDDATKEKAVRTVQSLASKYQGIMGLVILDMTKVDATHFGMTDGAGPLPMLGILFYDHNKGEKHSDPVLMDASLDVEEHAAGFIDEHLSLQTEQSTAEHLLSPVDTEDEGRSADDPSEVERLDDQVALGVHSLRKKPVDMSRITVLTDKTFFKVTREAQLIMVLFYLTFDARSMAFLRLYAEASKVLEKDNMKPLAVVECYDWTDVCKKVNVTSYPLVRVYRRGREPVQYKGMLDANSVIDAIKLYLADDPVRLSSSEDVDKFVTGTKPENIELYTNTSVLGLMTNKDDISSFQETAEKLHGIYVSGLVTGDLARSISGKYSCQPPCVVVIKRDDPYQPHIVYKGDLKPDSIVQFVHNARVPVFAEISVKSFPTLYARKKPFVILFGEGMKAKEGVHGTLGGLVNKFSTAIFTYIDMSNQKVLGNKLLSSYGFGSKLPALVVVDLPKRSVFGYPKESLEPEEISDWLSTVLENKAEPDKLLPVGEWKPKHPGYNFLKMIDDDLRNKAEGLSTRDEVYDEGSIPDEEEAEDLEEENGPEEEQADDDIQQDLEDLKKSRLFHTHHSHEASHPKHQPKAASPDTPPHQHTEL